MSDTPLTDAAASEGAYMSDGDYSSTQGKQFVHVDFARKLERELSEANELSQELAMCLDSLEVFYSRLPDWNKKNFSSAIIRIKAMKSEK